MRLIQHNQVKDVYYVNYHTSKIVTTLLKGGESLKCSITISDVILGKYDLNSAGSLGRAYKRFTEQFTQHLEIFADVNDFSNLFLRIGEKLRLGEFVREESEDERVLTLDALDFLKAPDILDRMDRVERLTTKDPLVDCEEDLLLFNLVIVSCKTERPITYEHTGPASSGKTWPARHAVAGFPKDMMFDPAGATDKSMKYNYDYQDPDTKEFVTKTGGKCIYFGESKDNRESVKLFKPMMSHDKERLDYLVTTKDPANGVMQAATYMLDGISSFILIGVQHMDDEEMNSRTMKGSPKVSQRKTERVIEETFEADTERIIWQPPEEMGVMHDAMFHLKKVYTRNIFGTILAKIFPKDDMRRARDMNRLRGLIQACTVLHQYQRPYEVIGDDRLLYSSLEDNLIALLLTDRLLESTILGIPATTIKIYEVMKGMREMDIPLTYNCVHEQVEANRMHMTMDTLKDTHIKVLENHQLIRVKIKGTKNKDRSYNINERYQDIYKVPKLTPMFIEELQNYYKELRKRYKSDFKKMEMPECPEPKTCITDSKNGSLEGLFGLRYFHPTCEGNVVWKVSTENMRALLFNDKHILRQKHLDITEQTKTINARKQAIRDIKSNKPSNLSDVTPLDEELYEEYKRERYGI